MDNLPINSYQYGCLNRTTAVNIPAWMEERFTRSNPNEKSYRQLASERDRVSLFGIKLPDRLTMPK